MGEMNVWVQVISSVVIGVVGLGLLIYVFNIIFYRLEKKLDKNVFEEHCKLVLSNFDHGQRRFSSLENAVNASTAAINELCNVVTQLKERVEARLPKEK